jgi:hypothetical protein
VLTSVFDSTKPKPNVLRALTFRSIAWSHGRNTRLWKQVRLPIDKFQRHEWSTLYIYLLSFVALRIAEWVKVGEMYCLPPTATSNAEILSADIKRVCLTTRASLIHTLPDDPVLNATASSKITSGQGFVRMAMERLFEEMLRNCEDPSKAFRKDLKVTFPLPHKTPELISVPNVRWHREAAPHRS